MKTFWRLSVQAALAVAIEFLDAVAAALKANSSDDLSKINDSANKQTA